jgi:hypothetical protein
LFCAKEIPAKSMIVFYNHVIQGKAMILATTYFLLPIFGNPKTGRGLSGVQYLVPVPFKI